MGNRVSVKCYPIITSKIINKKRRKKTPSRFIRYETRFAQNRPPFLVCLSSMTRKKAWEARRSQRSEREFPFTSENYRNCYDLEGFIFYITERAKSEIVSNLLLGFTLLSTGRETGHFLCEFIPLACSFYSHPSRVLYLALEKKSWMIAVVVKWLNLYHR